MGGVNKVILLLTLGKDPEITYTSGGMAICKFTGATSKKKKDGTEVTQWHRIVAFDKRGETIGRYVKKGQQLYVEGEIQYGKYTNKDNVEVNTTDIIVNQFSFVGNKSSNGQANQNVQREHGEPPAEDD